MVGHVFCDMCNDHKGAKNDVWKVCRLEIAEIPSINPLLERLKDVCTFYGVVLGEAAHKFIPATREVGNSVDDPLQLLC